LPCYAFLNRREMRVTALCVEKTMEAAIKAVKTPGRTDNRECRELPPRSHGWSLNEATEHCFPTYD
jgi:hypothetical protein